MKLAKSGDAYFSLDKVDQYILSQSNLKLPDDEKRPIINPYNKPREYIVLPEYLKDYKNVY